MHTLETDSVFLDFNGRTILSGVYLQCRSHEIVGLFGRNGQGKTCLMNIIYGTLAARYKCIRLDGITKASAYLEPHTIRYLPQFNFLPGHLKAVDAFELFDVDLLAFIDIFPEFTALERRISDLSGGQKRLLETYLVIKSKSWFVLLDEPFSHISPVQVEKLKVLIAAEKQHKGFVVTDHLFREVISISDKYYLLSEGKTYLVTDLNELSERGYVSSI